MRLLALLLLTDLCSLLADLREELASSSAIQRLSNSEAVLREIVGPLQDEHVEHLSHLCELPDEDLNDFIQRHKLSLGARIGIRHVISNFRQKKHADDTAPLMLYQRQALGEGKSEQDLRTNDTTCCIPAEPCGDIVCSVVDSAQTCRSFAPSQEALKALKASCESESSDNVTHDIGWGDALFPFVYVPLGTLSIMVAFWTVLGQVYKVAQDSTKFRRFIMNFIGCVDQPHPRNLNFMIVLNIGQIIASVAAIGLFIFNTYKLTLTPLTRAMMYVLGHYFLCDMLVSALQCEFRLMYLFRVGPLVDILTVPNMIVQGLNSGNEVTACLLSLSYLRSIKALFAYEKLDMYGVVGTGASEVTQAIVRSFLRFLVLVSCFASSVLVLEILGDLPFSEHFDVQTSMGKISYFTMVYWIIETISTVGYGDFAPTTVPSRLVAMLLMISGVAFFGIELDNILNISSKVKKGSGSYMPTPRAHVVLVGGGIRHVDESLVVAFLHELYHPSVKNQWPDLVIMTSVTKSLDQVRHIVDSRCEKAVHSLITYLVGSPLQASDLQRCRCDTVAMVFIIADTHASHDPFEEDTQNVLRALSLRSGFPQVRMRLMLLVPESESTAVSIGIRSQHCFSVNELKSNLFWQACRCKGWNTLVCNLMVSRDIDEDHLEKLKAISPWLENYTSGLDHEVYGLIADERFYDMSYATYVIEAYKTKGVCIFAAQIYGQIVLAPFAQINRITEEHVFFAFARNEEQLDGVAVIGSPDVDWKATFLKHRQQMLKSIDDTSKASKRSSGHTSPKTRLTLVGDLPQFDGARDPLLHSTNSVTSGAVSTSASEDGLKVGSKKPTLVDEDEDEDENEIVEDEPEDADAKHQEALRLIAESKQVVRIRRGAGKQPFILMLDLSASWRQVQNFIRHSRSEYMPFHMPIVVLSTAEPPKNFFSKFEQAQFLETVAFVQGNPRSSTDLTRSGVQECSVVVCLGQGLEATKDHGGDHAMLDAEVVMVHRLLLELGAEDKSLILDFKRIDNMRLLPNLAEEEDAHHFLHEHEHLNFSSPKGRPPSLLHKVSRLPRTITSGGWRPLLPGFAFLRHKSESDDDKQQDSPHGRTGKISGSVYDPRFASGQIFTPQVLGSLMAHAFHTPGIVEVMQELVHTSSKDHTAAHAVFPWQIYPKAEYVGLSYGDLLCRLASDPHHPVLPVAIFRAPAPSDSDFGYVWTNPASPTKILATDLIYVLGDHKFGKAAYEDGLLWPAGKPSKKKTKKTDSTKKSKTDNISEYQYLRCAAPRCGKQDPGKMKLCLNASQQAGRNDAFGKHGITALCTEHVKLLGMSMHYAQAAESQT